MVNTKIFSVVRVNLWYYHSLLLRYSSVISIFCAQMWKSYLGWRHDVFVLLIYLAAVSSILFMLAWCIALDSHNFLSRCEPGITMPIRLVLCSKALHICFDIYMGPKYNYSSCDDALKPLFQETGMVVLTWTQHQLLYSCMGLKTFESAWIWQKNIQDHESVWLPADHDYCYF